MPAPKRDARASRVSTGGADISAMQRCCFEHLPFGVKLLSSLIFGNPLRILGFGMMLSHSLRRRLLCPI